MKVNRATGSLMVAALLAFLAQLVIDPSPTNVLCACLVLGSSLAVLFYIQATPAIQQQPISTFTILGFNITTQLGALLAQTVSLTSLTDSLRQPVQTFATLAGYQLIALAVHAACRLFAHPAEGKSLPRRFLERAGVYATPTPRQLWVMGFIGCLSYAVLGRAAANGEANSGVVHGVAIAFNFLIYAPFLIPVYIKIREPGYERAKGELLGLAVYFAAVCVVALALNVRAIMFSGVVTVGLVYLLLWLRSDSGDSKERAPMWKGVLVSTLLVLVAAPLSDLATAMVVARGERGKVSAGAMIRNTLDVFWSKHYLIQRYREREQRAQLYSPYDESYLANPLFARLVETKFHDNALYFAGTLESDASRERLRKVSVDFLWSTLPTPLLKLCGVRVDKNALDFSMGDYLAYLSRGLRLGGRKTGSMFAQGQVLFGTLFPFVYAALCFVAFKWMDFLCCRSTKGIFPAPVALLSLWPFTHYLAPESLHQFFIAITRGFPQTIGVYACAFLIARWLTRSRQPAVSTLEPV
jgi:hypothetical protein